MRSAADRVCASGRAGVVGRDARRRAADAGGAGDQRSARRPQAGPARRRRGGAQHGTESRTCRSRRASSIRRRPAGNVRAAASGRRPVRPPRAAAPPFDPVASNRLGFTNSDLAFSGNHVFVGNYHGFNTYDVERPNKPKLLASVVCPGGQGDVSVYGNLLFMSVEQTRGRLDCGTQGVQTPVSAERFRGVRIFDITDVNKPKQVAAIQTCRGSHTHTLVPDPNDKANLYVYGSGTSSVRSAEELAGCSGLDAEGGSEHLALQHRRDPGAAGRAAEREDRQPAAHLCRHRDRQPRRPVAGRPPRRGDADLADDQPVPRHHGLPGGRPGRRRLLGQRDPARHPRSEEPGPPRSRRRQELRLLAFGDVQQRRHEGRLHRRVGRRRPAALPRDRSADLGRRRDLRRRRPQDCASPATSRCRRRRPSRRTASRTTAR